jgi:hypothetical protein
VGVGSRGALEPRELLPEPLLGTALPPLLPLLLLRLRLPPPPLLVVPETRPDVRAPPLGALFGGDDLAGFAAAAAEAVVLEVRPVDLDSLVPAAAEAACGWPGSTGAGGIDLIASPEPAQEGV